MKKIILALFSVSLLSACGSSSDNKDKNQRSDTPEVVETDYSVCDRGARPASLEGQWKRESHFDRMKTSTVVEIKNNSIQVSNTCSMEGRSLNVKASTAIAYDSSKIELLGSATDSDEIHQNDFNLSCSVNLEPVKVNYKFQGQCLVLSFPNDSKDLAFVPVE